MDYGLGVRGGAAPAGFWTDPTEFQCRHSGVRGDECLANRELDIILAPTWLNRRSPPSTHPARHHPAADSASPKDSSNLSPTRQHSRDRAIDRSGADAIDDLIRLSSADGDRIIHLAAAACGPPAIPHDPEDDPTCNTATCDLRSISRSIFAALNAARTARGLTVDRSVAGEPEQPPPMPAYARVSACPIARLAARQQSGSHEPIIPASSRRPPLKAVAPPHLDLHALSAWGARYNHLLSASLLEHLDLGAIPALRMRSSPLLIHYINDLVRYGWYRVVGRRALHNTVRSLAFPVLKSDGRQARWVVDVLLNRISLPTLPMSCQLASVEDVSDAWLFYRYAREDDGVSWYGQHRLADEIAHLFASSCGSLTAVPLVMLQGWEASTAIAQDNLRVIYDAVAWSCGMAGIVRHPSADHDYVDNHLALFHDLESATMHHTASELLHTRVRGQFTMGQTTRTPTFAGLALAHIGSGERTIGPKNQWVVATTAWLHRISVAREAMGDTRAVLTIAGTIIWALRSSRRCIASHAPALLRLLRTKNPSFPIAPDSDLLGTFARVAEILSSPTRYTRPTRLCIASIDATPARIAVVISASMFPLTLPRDGACDSRNPLVNIATAAWRAHANRPVQAEVYALDIPQNHINISETLAFALLATVAPSNALIAVASDSVVASAWVRRGICAEPAIPILDAITSALRATHSRLVIAKVDTKLNNADAFTRHDARTGHVVTTFPGSLSSPFRVTTWVA